MDPNARETSDTPQDASDSERPSHGEDGVDLTLIRWMLSRTPLQRLQVLQQHIQALARLHDANPHL
jgi:hypothetical protein